MEKGELSIARFSSICLSRGPGQSKDVEIFICYLGYNEFCG